MRTSNLGEEWRCITFLAVWLKGAEERVRFAPHLSAPPATSNDSTIADKAVHVCDARHCANLFERLRGHFFGISTRGLQSAINPASYSLQSLPHEPPVFSTSVRHASSER